MTGTTKERRRLADEWTSMLPDGRKADYRSKRLASGKYKISAAVVGATLNHSKVVDFPVSRTDVETVFLSDLIDTAA